MELNTSNKTPSGGTGGPAPVWFRRGAAGSWKERKTPALRGGHVVGYNARPLSAFLRAFFVGRDSSVG